MTFRLTVIDSLDVDISLCERGGNILICFQSPRTPDSLRELLHPHDVEVSPDIYCISFQELASTNMYDKVDRSMIFSMIIAVLFKVLSYGCRYADRSRRRQGSHPLLLGAQMESNGPHNREKNSTPLHIRY